MTACVIESEISSVNSARYICTRPSNTLNSSSGLSKPGENLYCRMACMAAVLFALVTGCSERTSNLHASNPFCSPTFISCKGGPVKTCASKNIRFRERCLSTSESPVRVIGSVNGSARSIAVSSAGAATPTYALKTNLKAFHS